MTTPAPAPDRVLILGASGFIGRWVAVALHARGGAPVLQVRTRRRLAATDAPAGLQVVEADLARPGAVAALVDLVRPDLVINLAGYGVAKDERDPALAARLNEAMVAELAEALARRPAARPGLRLLQVGSALEAGPGAKTLDEAGPCRPTTDYGRTKLAGTRAVLAARAAGLAALVARPFTVFGPGERPGRLVPTLIAARGGLGRIPLSAGTQSRDWIYVEDLARALADLAALDPAPVQAGRYPFDAGILNVASGTLTTVRAFVEELALALGIARERLGFGDLPGLPEEMHHPSVPDARLAAAISWRLPRGPASGIERLARRLDAAR